MPTRPRDLGECQAQKRISPASSLMGLTMVGLTMVGLTVVGLTVVGLTGFEPATT